MLHGTVLLLAAALAMTGCATSGDPVDDVRGTVDAFLLNCRRGDGPSAQETLTEPARAIFTALPSVATACARILSQPRADIDFARARVMAAGTVSSQATATVAFPRGRAQLRLSRGREGWLIEGPS